jgi:hypothetical protein
MLDVRVEVLDVDEAGAVPVRAPSECARQLLVADVAPDGDDLTALDVGAEGDCELGQTLDAVGRDPR